jgi:MFS transporter, CP family, cyanate transporter
LDLGHRGGLSVDPAAGLGGARFGRTGFDVAQAVVQGAAQRVPVLPGRTTSARVAIVAGVCAGLHVVKLPPALTALQAALGISLVQAGFLLSLVQLAGMTAGVAFGALADGWGARRSMLTGLWILAAVSAAGGAAQSLTVMLLLRALEGLGFLLVVLPAPALVRALVPPAQHGRMLALWSAYMPAAATLALLLGPLVLQAWGWRVWWWLLALLTGGMALALAALVPPDVGRATPALGLPTQGRLRQTLAAPGPWLVALAFCVYAGQWMAVIGFLPTLYAQAGVPAAWVGPLTALAAAVNIVGNLLAGRWLQAGVAPARLLAAGYLAMAVFSVVVFWALAPGAAAPEPAAAPSLGLSSGSGLAPAFPTLPFLWRYGAVILFSALGGLIPGTLFPLAARLAPTEGTVSTTVGWMQQGSALGQFTLPPLVAWVATQAGGWQWSWVVTLGACTAGLASAYALSRTPVRVAGA